MGTKENVSLELFTGDEAHLAQTWNLLTAATQKFYLFTYYVSPSLYYYPEGYFLVKDYWGCAAGWGRIFTTRMTIMGLHF